MLDVLNLHHVFGTCPKTWHKWLCHPRCLVIIPTLKKKNGLFFAHLVVCAMTALQPEITSSLESVHSVTIRDDIVNQRMARTTPIYSRSKMKSPESFVRIVPECRRIVDKAKESRSLPNRLSFQLSKLPITLSRADRFCWRPPEWLAENQGGEQVYPVE
jgi:hypothetical protein